MQLSQNTMEHGKLKVLLILVLTCSVIDFSKDNDQPRENNDKAVAQGNTIFFPVLVDICGFRISRTWPLICSDPEDQGLEIPELLCRRLKMSPRSKPPPERQFDSRLHMTPLPSYIWKAFILTLSSRSGFDHSFLWYIVICSDRGWPVQLLAIKTRMFVEGAVKLTIFSVYLEKCCKICE